MNTIFINSKSSVTSDPYRLLLNQREVINMLLYQTLAFTINGKIKKSQTKIMNLKYTPEHAIKNFNYLIDYVL